MKIVVLCFFVFVAGFIDSIAGGGGLISLPAYFFIELPTHQALGTNKFSATCGTTFATIKFSLGKAIHWKVAIISGIASFITSLIATKLALMIDEKILHFIILIILPFVAFFVLLKKDFGENKNIEKPNEDFKFYSLAFFIGLIIGFYDGLIGPATGTFAIIAYSTLMKYDLVTSSGNAKVLNLASNYASMTTFFSSGKIVFNIGIPAAICGIAGNYLGSAFAVKKGNRFIKIFMLIAIILLFAKMAWDLFASLK
ncbi:MAG: TSUP family transporter [Treponemataceae bacterium]